MLGAYPLSHVLSLRLSHILSPSSFNVDSHRWPDAPDVSALATATRPARAPLASPQPHDTLQLASERGHRPLAVDYLQKARAWSLGVQSLGPKSRASVIVPI